jgi:acyl-coenzyme A thioesterase PaaI-like protein
MVNQHPQSFRIPLSPIHSPAETNPSHRTAPHGGYLLAILHRLVTTHFARTHPTLHNSAAWPITMQISYLHRSDVGPALLTIRDVKLGRRTSTVHVALSQNGKEKVAGYVTVSDELADEGITLPTRWELNPAPVASGPPVVDERGEVVGASSRVWRRVRVDEGDEEYRRVAMQSMVYVPAVQEGEYSVLDQWTRLWPGGERGGKARWTDEAAAHLLDIFPGALMSMEKAVAGGRKGEGKDEVQAMWFPTVVLNVDFKRRLPEEGVEWLYSRVSMKSVLNGRTDIGVEMLDEEGRLVAVMSQVGMVMSASRNVGAKM